MPYILMQLICTCQALAFISTFAIITGMKNNLAVKNLKDKLKTHKLKSTSARLALLDIFEHNKKPLSVKGLAEKLDSTGVDTVTLYRNVESLENAGLLKRIFIDNKQAYYELESQEHHHHLICKVCGKISDITGCSATISNKNLLKINGFAKVTGHSLEFFGVCNNCIKKP
jgi:Fur family transcriptional regulator, ferric uptake regulator